MRRLPRGDGAPELTNGRFERSSTHAVCPDSDPDGGHTATEVPAEGAGDHRTFCGKDTADRHSLGNVCVRHPGTNSTTYGWLARCCNWRIVSGATARAQRRTGTR